MFYPEDFKKRLIALFPDDKYLHDALDRGDAQYVSAELRNSVKLPNDLIELILNATSLEELKDEARQRKEISNLYHECVDLIIEENKKRKSG